MSLVAVLAEGLAVVRSDDDDGVLQLTDLVEAVVQVADHPVGPVDGHVVVVRVATAECGRALAVGVLVEVHHVQVDEEALLAEGAKEVRGRDQAVLVRALEGRPRRMLRLGVHVGRARTRPQVELEALGEAEVGSDPAVAEDTGRAEADVAQDLGGHQRFVWQRVVVAQDPVVQRQCPRPQRRHRGLGPARLRHDVAEDDPVPREGIQVLGRGPFVAVGADTVGPQGVDQDEDQVEIVAVPERRDLGGLAHVLGGNAHVDLGGDGDEGQEAGRDEVRGRRVEQAAKHSSEHTLRRRRS